MRVVRPDGAHAFLDLAGPLLERDEARSNLILGIAGTLVQQPEAHAVVRTWVALEAGAPVAAALRTPPHNLVLGDPASDGALDALLDGVLADEAVLPGVQANEPHAHRAASTLSSRLGVDPELALHLGVHALTEVRPVQRPPGASRPAAPEDRDLLRAWLGAFILESLPDPETQLDGIERSLDTRFAPPGGGLWFWEDEGEPVSISGYGGPTPTGIRIGPVYTPPTRRRRGYATGLVADQSAWLLDHGRRACFLFTDLSNPTSNAIYERIGCRRVAEAVEIRFVDRPA